MLAVTCYMQQFQVPTLKLTGSTSSWNNNSSSFHRRTPKTTYFNNLVPQPHISVRFPESSRRKLAPNLKQRAIGTAFGWVIKRNVSFTEAINYFSQLVKGFQVGKPSPRFAHEVFTWRRRIGRAPTCFLLVTRLVGCRKQ